MNTVGLQGGGFAANSNVTVTLGGVMVTQSTTSPQGIVALSFVVPSGTAAGPTTITVTDSASPPNSASIAFTVYNATIAISPTSAASNSPVNVSGSGWPANGLVGVYLGQPSVDSFLCYVGADASGAFSQSCLVNLHLAQGSYAAVATDGSIIATGNQVTGTPAISYTTT